MKIFLDKKILIKKDIRWSIIWYINIYFHRYLCNGNIKIFQFTADDVLFDAALFLYSCMSAFHVVVVFCVESFLYLIFGLHCVALTVENCFYFASHTIVFFYFVSISCFKKMAQVNFVFVLPFFLLSLLSVVSCSGVECNSDADTSELYELKQDDPRLVKSIFLIRHMFIH